MAAGICLKSLLILSVLVAHTSVAGPCCNTPTLWTFKNGTQSAVKLSCELVSSSAWAASTSVSITTASIPAGENLTHNWGSDWYSDGMGLIPGKWSCRETGVSTKKPIVFSTDWGENITIHWNGIDSVIAKSVEHNRHKAAKN